MACWARLVVVGVLGVVGGGVLGTVGGGGVLGTVGSGDFHCGGGRTLLATAKETAIKATNRHRASWDAAMVT